MLETTVNLPDTAALWTPWYVWGAIIIALTLLTFVGTWLVTRRWK